MALDPTINLISAARGAAGTTTIEGAVRARLRPTLEKKVSRAGGSELPDRVWMTGAGVLVEIETEDSDEWLEGLTGASSVEILTLVYQAGSGSKTLTVGGAELVDVGELPMDPREEGANVTRHGLTFRVVQNGADDTLAELLTVA